MTKLTYAFTSFGVSMADLSRRSHRQKPDFAKAPSWRMAEEVRFELTISLRIYRFSRAAPSTTQALLQSVFVPSGGIEPPLFPLGRDCFNPLSYEGCLLYFLWLYYNLKFKMMQNFYHLTTVGFWGVIHWWFFPLLVWTLIWKGLALWRAARLGSKPWFVVLLIINTAGILEILYLYVFSRKAKSVEEEK